MLKITIPGRKEIQLKWLVLDFNGTIALDGQIIPEVVPLLQELAKELEIYVLTADTFGTARVQCLTLPVTLHCLQTNDHTQEKGEFVAKLGQENVIAFGNGANDVEMLKNAQLGIGILGQEGCAAGVFPVAELIVPGIQYALELLLKPKRLVATLRK